MTDLNQFFGDGFDSQTVEPDTGFEPLKPGKYPVCIEKAECRQTKAKNGHYVWLEMTVIGDGPGNGRKLWSNITIDNPNAKAVEIGRGQLSALCRAVDVPKANTVALFINKVLFVSVRIKEEQSDVTGFFHPQSETIQKYLVNQQQAAQLAAASQTQQANTQPMQGTMVPGQANAFAQPNDGQVTQQQPTQQTQQPQTQQTQQPQTQQTQQPQTQQTQQPQTPTQVGGAPPWNRQ
jgi:hypothetical protein